MSNESTKDTKEPFRSIIDQELSAVVFIMDYVQLQFGGLRPVLTAVTLPKVRVGDKEFSSATPGYRDSLCERITRSVRRASVREGQEILIEFDDGSRVSVSLKPEDYRAAEAATFDNGPNDYWVW
jgi:hypothetical protein